MSVDAIACRLTWTEGAAQAPDTACHKCKGVAEAAQQSLLMIDVAPQMAAEAAVRGSVGTSRRVLDEAYETGTAILGSMASQRDTLKVHEIAHDVWMCT